MLNYTNTVYDNQNVPAADDGSWTGRWLNLPHRSGRTHCSLDCHITGTATVELEGTNDIVAGVPTLLKEETASDAIVAESFMYIRARVTSAVAGAKVTVTTDVPGCYLS